MKFLIVIATVLVAAYAQNAEYEDEALRILPDERQPIIFVYDEDDDRIRHPRFRRGVSIDPKTGHVTADHKTDDSRVFGTLGSTDTGLFGKAGYEKNVFNDHRGTLDANAYGRRDLSPYGDSTSMGGGLKWRNDNAAASFDASKQIHGGTSWTAAGGGRWPIGKSGGNFGVDATYSHLPGGIRDYGGRASVNFPW